MNVTLDIKNLEQNNANAAHIRKLRCIERKRLKFNLHLGEVL